MFGKINFGSSYQSKPINNNNQQSSSNNKTITPINTSIQLNQQQSSNQKYNHNNKSFLSNPKFNNNNIKIIKQQQINNLSKSQTNNKHNQSTITSSNHLLDKTKQIKKIDKFNNNNNNFNKLNNNNEQNKQNNQQNKQNNQQNQQNNQQNKQNNQQNKQNNQQNKQNKKLNQLQNQMQGSKFRILNQILYTSSSQQAMKHFQQNPQDYITYHQGYRIQSQKWQSKPVNVIIKYLRKSFKLYKDKIICDLGCGQGFLYQGLTKQSYSKENQQGNITQVKNKHVFNPKNIHSFDLVALKPFIKVADIKNLPIQTASVDVTVFCLSLMGKNYLQFIQQAHRVLKEGSGQLIIAEVQSRSKNWRIFIDMLQMIGFELVNNGVSIGSGVKVENSSHSYGQGNKSVANNQQGKYFRILQFVKNSICGQDMRKIRYDDKTYGKDNIADLAPLLLTECIYKKR